MTTTLTDNGSRFGIFPYFFPYQMLHFPVGPCTVLVPKGETFQVTGETSGTPEDPMMSLSNRKFWYDDPILAKLVARGSLPAGRATFEVSFDPDKQLCCYFLDGEAARIKAEELNYLRDVARRTVQEDYQQAKGRLLFVTRALAYESTDPAGNRGRHDLYFDPPLAFRVGDDFPVVGDRAETHEENDSRGLIPYFVPYWDIIPENLKDPALIGYDGFHIYGQRRFITGEEMPVDADEWRWATKGEEQVSYRLPEYVTDELLALPMHADMTKLQPPSAVESREYVMTLWVNKGGYRHSIIIDGWELDVALHQNLYSAVWRLAALAIADLAVLYGITEDDLESEPLTVRDNALNQIVFSESEVLAYMAYAKKRNA